MDSNQAETTVRNAWSKKEKMAVVGKLMKSYTVIATNRKLGNYNSQPGSDLITFLQRPQDCLPHILDTASHPTCSGTVKSMQGTSLIWGNFGVIPKKGDSSLSHGFEREREYQHLVQNLCLDENFNFPQSVCCLRFRCPCFVPCFGATLWEGITLRLSTQMQMKRENRWAMFHHMLSEVIFLNENLSGHDHPLAPKTSVSIYNGMMRRWGGKAISLSPSLLSAAEWLLVAFW